MPRKTRGVMEVADIRCLDCGHVGKLWLGSGLVNGEYVVLACEDCSRLGLEPGVNPLVKRIHDMVEEEGLTGREKSSRGHALLEACRDPCPSGGSFKSAIMVCAKCDSENVETVKPLFDIEPEEREADLVTYFNFLEKEHHEDPVLEEISRDESIREWIKRHHEKIGL